MIKTSTPQIERYRVRAAGGDWAIGTPNGHFEVPSPEGRFKLRVIASNGGGWDHASVSLPNRVPTYREMCAIKDLFWADDEVVMQLHVAKKHHININENCLHLWRPQTLSERNALPVEYDEPSWPTPGPIPLPPAIAV